MSIKSQFHQKAKRLSGDFSAALGVSSSSPSSSTIGASNNSTSSSAATTPGGTPSHHPHTAALAQFLSNLGHTISGATSGAGAGASGTSVAAGGGAGATGSTAAYGNNSVGSSPFASITSNITSSSPSSGLSHQTNMMKQSNKQQPQSSSSLMADIEMTDYGQYRKSVVHSYTVRFIGSTPLRRRQTYPMLNWIITDLLYQSKCIGLDLSVCITNCLMKENDQERMKQFQLLKQQLDNSTAPYNNEQDVTTNTNNGLVVRMDIIDCNASNNQSSPNDNADYSPSNSPPNSPVVDKYAFQMSNPSDGQHLLRHKFSRIFLLGKYARQPCLFYYVHKSDDDVLTSVPTIYLFQALNPVQLTEICLRFNELRPKNLISTSPSREMAPPSTGSDRNKSTTSSSTSSSSSKTCNSDPNDMLYIYNPLLDQNQINVNNNCFEVRHIGSIVISQKRSTPSMIDRATEKLIQQNRDNQQRSSNNADVSGATQTANTSAPETATTPSAATSKTESECNSQRASPARTTSNMKPTVTTTTGSVRQYRKNRFLVQVIEENEQQLDNETQQQHHNQTPNQDNKQAEPPISPVTKQIPGNLSSASNEPNKTMLFIIGTMDICLISTENHRTIYSKVFANISHCSQGSKHADHFGVIVREPYVPPTAAAAAAAATPGSQSASPARDFLIQKTPATATGTGTTSTTTSTTPNSAPASNDSFVLHIFECQSESIVNDLLCSLRQSFNNAFRQSKPSANTATAPSSSSTSSSSNLPRQQSLQNTGTSSKDNSPMFASNENLETVNIGRRPATYCHNCPMNWFHQLCLDIYGLDDVKIFAMLLHRIRHGSNERRWKEYLAVFEYLQMERLEQKVDLLVIMLKARVDKMQRYHEIRDGQCRMDIVSLFEQINEHDPVLRHYQQQKSTLSLNRLEGLRLMAKSSFSNTFDAFRKRNQRNSQSNENLHPSVSPSPSPSSSMTNILLASGPHSPMSTITANNQPPGVGASQSNNVSSSNANANHSISAAKAFQRRNTVADCCGDDGIDLPASTPSHRLLAKSDSVAGDEDHQHKMSHRNQPLMNIYIKTSTGNAMSSGQFTSMEELRNNLQQLLDPNILNADSSDSNSSSMKSVMMMDDVLGDDDNFQQLHKQQNNKPTTNTNSTNSNVGNVNNNTNNMNTKDTSVQMRHRLFRRIRKALNNYPGGKADIERLINQQLFRNSSSTTQPTTPNAQQQQQQPQSNTTTSIDHKTTQQTHTTANNKARHLWQFAIRKQIQLIKLERIKQMKLQHQQLLQRQAQEEEDELQSIGTTDLNCQQESGNISAVTSRIIDRVGNLYEDIPPIITQSQLEMMILQWTKLIEMFEQYCHNNPDQSSNQSPTPPLANQAPPPTSTNAQNGTGSSPSIHWWSHYERSIVQALRMGVPKEIRSRVWKFLAKYRRYRNNSDQSDVSNKQLYRTLLKQLAIHQHAIMVDLGRTFPTVPYFAEAMGPGQLALYNLLKAYSLLDKEVEYCQGLSFVAGILLLHMDEDDAFDQFCYVLYECGLREQYKPSMDALQMQMYQLNRLLYDLNRPLYDHLDRMDVSPTLYAAPSFLTLFASQFSIQFVSRVFDLLMFYGMESIFRVFYYLIDRIRDELLSVEAADFENCMQLMRTRLLTLSTDEMVQLFDRCLVNTNTTPTPNANSAGAGANVNCGNNLNPSTSTTTPSTNNSSSTSTANTQTDFHGRLEQYRLEYQILKEEFVHLNQINKLAVEQKLQQQQQQQKKQQTPTTGAPSGEQVTNKQSPPRRTPPKQQEQEQQQSTTAQTTTTQQQHKQNETVNGAKNNELELLREENRILRRQNDELCQQMKALKCQLDEMSKQFRRQSR